MVSLGGSNVEDAMQTEKPIVVMERELAHAIEAAEKGYRGDAPMNAMDALNELFDEPQPLPILERCLAICTEFEELEEGSIAPRYFIILRALIFAATFRPDGKGQRERLRERSVSITPEEYAMLEERLRQLMEEWKREAGLSGTVQ
jgi:hypothetical protein